MVQRVARRLGLANIQKWRQAEAAGDPLQTVVEPPWLAAVQRLPTLMPAS